MTTRKPTAADRALLLCDVGFSDPLPADHGPPPWLRLVRWSFGRPCLVAYSTRKRPTIGTVQGRDEEQRVSADRAMRTLCGKTCELAESTGGTMPKDPICMACGVRAGKMRLR